MDNIFQYEHPFVCTDAVVFTISTQIPDSYRKLPVVSLKILLYQRENAPYQDKWSLPGGFLNIDEMPKDNIHRKILEKSHVEHCYLEQLYTFCDLTRDPRARVISLAYLGLMNEAESKRLANESTWFTVQVKENGNLSFHNSELELEEADLGFDHAKIIRMAVERLQSKLLYSDIVFHLLPQEFTLTQMQNVYETILGKREQAANFRRKVIGLVQETEHSTSDKGHRPAKLYTKKVQD